MYELDVPQYLKQPPAKERTAADRLLARFVSKQRAFFYKHTGRDLLITIPQDVIMSTFHADLNLYESYAIFKDWTKEHSPKAFTYAASRTRS